jgi:hypothetical protein
MGMRIPTLGDETSARETRADPTPRRGDLMFVGGHQVAGSPLRHAPLLL